jgi:hypothetical protein
MKGRKSSLQNREDSLTGSNMVSLQKSKVSAIDEIDEDLLKDNNSSLLESSFGASKKIEVVNKLG